jgi:hypothetical protein
MGLTRDERLSRFERIMAMRGDGLAYEAIGAALDPPLSKQRVLQIVASGPPRPTGRPAGPERRARLRSRLVFHERRLRVAIKKGAAQEPHRSRVAALAAELAQMPAEKEQA